MVDSLSMIGYGITIYLEAGRLVISKRRIQTDENTLGESLILILASHYSFICTIHFLFFFLFFGLFKFRLNSFFAKSRGVELVFFWICSVINGIDS